MKEIQRLKYYGKKRQLEVMKELKELYKQEKVNIKKINRVIKMDEYKKLLVLVSAIENLEGTVSIDSLIQPLKEWAEKRIIELEELSKNK